MRRLLLPGLVSVTLLSVTAAPALASPGTSPAGTGTLTKVGPYPVTQPPVSEPAGRVCPFGFGIAFPTQNLTETDYYDSSGTLAESFFNGPLIAVFTNLSTGRSATRSLSGPGWYYYHPDGSLTIDATAHIGVGFHVGDSPSGEYLITNGPAVINISATGVKTLVSLQGTAENMCTTLAG